MVLSQPVDPPVHEYPPADEYPTVPPPSDDGGYHDVPAYGGPDDTTWSADVPPADDATWSADVPADDASWYGDDTQGAAWTDDVPQDDGSYQDPDVDHEGL